MKFSATIFTFLLVCLYCEANDTNSVCQVYDAKTRTLEKYCSGQSPPDCSATTKPPSNDASSVEKLKFHGCNSTEVLNTTKLYQSIRVLDISDFQYNSIDWLNVPLEHLKHFNASNNRIENITDLLANAPYVKSIDLSNNRLRTISIDDFGMLNELIDINLSNNFIQYINSNGFSKISPNLEHIDLRNNELVGIPEFPTCKKLRVLHLEDNTIKNVTYQRIPWHANTLSAIYLSWTYVERFDGGGGGGVGMHDHLAAKHQFRIIWDGDNEGILRTTNGTTVTYELHCNQQSFRNLRTFIAGHSAFINVIDLIRSFDGRLIELDVSGNGIGKWDQVELKRFNNLEKLSLRDTRLTHFNLAMIENARNLHVLDISNNGLDHLHSITTLSRFVHLKHFDVSGNRLQYDTTLKIFHYITANVEVIDLSDSYVGKLLAKKFYRFEQRKDFNSTLKTLRLRNTHVEFTDSRNPFEQLPNLRNLDLSHNNLSNADFRTLSDTLIKLRSLNVANCELKMPLNILQYFGQALNELNLSGNRIGDAIDQINACPFQTLTNLIHLNLSATDLHQFNFQIIDRQEWLYTVDLSNNHLQAINLHALPRFVHLKRLYLQNNELETLDQFKPNESPHVSLALAQNRLPCLYLKQLKYHHPHLKYMGNQLDQKHGIDCRSSIQAIGDFLGSVYDTVKFW